MTQNVVEINSKKAKKKGLKLFNGTAVNITDTDMDCRLFSLLRRKAIMWESVKAELNQNAGGLQQGSYDK